MQNPISTGESKKSTGHSHRNKIIKDVRIAPIVFVKLLIKRTGKKLNRRKADRTLIMKALVDSGASNSVMT